MNKLNLAMVSGNNSSIFYGVCGEEAFIDSHGDMLYTGDLVRLFYDEDGTNYGLRAVCKYENKFIVMGLAELGADYHEVWSVYKEKSYKSMKIGDSDSAGTMYISSEDVVSNKETKSNRSINIETDESINPTTVLLTCKKTGVEELRKAVVVDDMIVLFNYADLNFNSLVGDILPFTVKEITKEEQDDFMHKLTMNTINKLIEEYNKNSDDNIFYEFDRFKFHKS